MGALTQAAARGVTVVCLAPAGGTFVWPGADEPLPQRLSLRRQEVISDLDPRLDAHAWPSVGRVAACGVIVQGDGRGQAMAFVSQSKRAWPWLEARYDRATLVVCGFEIIRCWDDGPTPRFLLARMLDYLTKQPQS